MGRHFVYLLHLLFTTLPCSYLRLYGGCDGLHVCEEQLASSYLHACSSITATSHGTNSFYSLYLGDQGVKYGSQVQRIK